MYYYEFTKNTSIRTVSSGYRLIPAGIYKTERKFKQLPAMAPYHASRIWKDSDDIIVYIKDRLAWDREVDPKEFLWVKLKAKPLENFL